jgi:hypothetical protein
MINLGAPVDLYCERLTRGLFAEPLNGLSNLAFLGASAWLLLRPEAGSGPWYARVLAAQIFLIGLASLSFHLFATSGTEILDVLFIGLFIYCFVGCYFRHFFSWPWWCAALALPGFAGFSQLIEMPFPAGALNGSVDYLPPLGALLLMALSLFAARRPGAGKLAAAALVFPVSLALRTMDRAWCLSLPIGTHWLWHCLNALTLTLVVLSLDRPAASTSSSGVPT